MGHTIPPKRNIIYAKLDALLRFASVLREPYRSRFEGMIHDVYSDISGMVYANSLYDDEMIVYAMLFERSKSLTIESREQVVRCLAILLTG